MTFDDFLASRGYRVSYDDENDRMRVYNGEDRVSDIDGLYEAYNALQQSAPALETAFSPAPAPEPAPLATAFAAQPAPAQAAPAPHTLADVQPRDYWEDPTNLLTRLGMKQRETDDGKVEWYDPNAEEGDGRIRFNEDGIPEVGPMGRADIAGSQFVQQDLADLGYIPVNADPRYLATVAQYGDGQGFDGDPATFANFVGGEGSTYVNDPRLGLLIKAGDPAKAKNPTPYALPFGDTFGDMMKEATLALAPVFTMAAAPALATAFGGGTLGTMGAGATIGGATSAVAGGDPLKGALLGGIGAGIAPTLAGAGVTDPILQQAVSGGLKTALGGGDVVTGALTGAANAGLNQLGNLIPDSWKDPSNFTFTNADSGSPDSGDAQLDVTNNSLPFDATSYDANVDNMDYSQPQSGGTTAGGNMTDFYNPDADLMDYSNADVQDWAMQHNALNPDGTVNWDAIDQGLINPTMGSTDGAPGDSSAASGGAFSIGNAIKWLLGSGGAAAAGGSGTGSGSGGIPPALLLALAGGLFENPDRTTTTKVDFPPEYQAGINKALGLADQVSGMGSDIVAPLSSNEQAGIDLAQSSAGGWKPYADRAFAALDDSQSMFQKGDALTDKSTGYLDQGDALTQSTLPYFQRAGQAAEGVTPYLQRSAALANQAAGGIPGVDLSKYEDPYTDAMLAPIMRRADIEKAQALADTKAKAGMRGAFGGSREALTTNLASESADRNKNEIEAGVRSQAFNTALQTAAADLNRQLQASGQYGNLATTQGNTSTLFTNAGTAINNAAGNYTKLASGATDAAKTEGALGTALGGTAKSYTDLGTAFGTNTNADVNRLMATGGTARTVDQARRAAPITAINAYTTALGRVPTTTTTTTPAASKLGQATGALTALAGAQKAGIFG